jgi:hypothetical protein
MVKRTRFVVQLLETQMPPTPEECKLFSMYQERLQREKWHYTGGSKPVYLFSELEGRWRREQSWLPLGEGFARAKKQSSSILF